MPMSRLVSKLAAVSAAVLVGTALSPAVAATATVPQCVPDHCDSLIVYFTDATCTTWVGQREDGPCGYVDYGVTTAFPKRFQQTC